MPRIQMPPSPPAQVFALSTPQHLLGKLYWEIEELEKRLTPSGEALGENLLAAYAAFNVAVTAWHMVDWVWKSADTELRGQMLADLQAKKKDLAAFKESLGNSCRDLLICQEIANGSKHKGVTRRTAGIRVEFKWRRRPLTTEEAAKWPPISPYHFELLIWDRGSCRNGLEVFLAAREFWERYLETWSFIESRFIGGSEDRS